MYGRKGPRTLLVRFFFFTRAQMGCIHPQTEMAPATAMTSPTAYQSLWPENANCDDFEFHFVDSRTDSTSTNLASDESSDELSTKFDKFETCSSFITREKSFLCPFLASTSIKLSEKEYWVSSLSPIPSNTVARIARIRMYHIHCIEENLKMADWFRGNSFLRYFVAENSYFYAEASIIFPLTRIAQKCQLLKIWQRND